ncbi:MAG: hypothetical protein IJS43_06290 [Bacteroidaceae bacterium]|nr:hypothetical protein [Bacteroidaceae bacterium]
MKKIIILLAFMVNICAFADDGTSMQPIIEKCETLTEYVEGELDQEIVRIEMDILTNSKQTIRSLSDGYTYQIIAFGDYRFKDIDVEVYRKSGGNWVLEEKDNDESEVAIVSVSPSYKQDYKIVIKAYQFNKGYSAGHYGLIICHEKD